MRSYSAFRHFCRQFFLVPIKIKYFESPKVTDCWISGVSKIHARRVTSEMGLLCTLRVHSTFARYRAPVTFSLLPIIAHLAGRHACSRDRCLTEGKCDIGSVARHVRNWR